MNTLEAMRVFVSVAEHVSFTRAAENLGLLKATVSLAVKELETSLGTRLLHRTTRSVQMTLDGRVHYERCKELLSEVDHVQTMFQQGGKSLRGRLRADMPSGIARLYVIPQLPQFLQAHLQVEFELSSTDRLVDPIQEGFDCVMRAGAPQDPQLIARPLGRLILMNCASPDYLRRRGTPQSIADLAHHDLIQYVSRFGGKSEGFEYPESGEYRTLPMSGPVVVNSSDAYNAACLAGLGLIQAPEIGVREYLASGVLVEVLPRYRPAPMSLSLLYAHRRNVPKRVRVFMDWVTDILRPVLAR
jgi:DNA-binding transcriptional LysR family regulator